MPGMSGGPNGTWNRRITLTFYVGLAVLAITQALDGRLDRIDVSQLQFTTTGELIISALGICLWIVTKPTKNGS
jgi:hypothetical protein